MKFPINTAALTFISLLAMSGMTYAAELDGKKVVCKFAEENGLREKEVFLSFSGSKVTVLDILIKNKRNSDYNFDYTSVELSRETKDFYLKPTSIFWGSFSSMNDIMSKPVTSREDIGVYLYLNKRSVGSWTYIDRNTLLAEDGVAISSQALTHSGKCEISDEAGEKAFTDKYQALKLEATKDYDAKLGNAKSQAPKL